MIYLLIYNLNISALMHIANQILKFKLSKVYIKRVNGIINLFCSYIYSILFFFNLEVTFKYLFFLQKIIEIEMAFICVLLFSLCASVSALHLRFSVSFLWCGLLLFSWIFGMKGLMFQLCLQLSVMHFLHRFCACSMAFDQCFLDY